MVVDPPPPPSDSMVVDPPPPPSDSGPDAGPDAGTDGGVNIDAATDSGMVVDPPPPPMDSGASLQPGSYHHEAAPDVLPLDPSFHVALRLAGRGAEGGVRLEAVTRHADRGTAWVWEAEAGELVADGRASALWLPPAEPGRYLVQVVALRGDDSASVAALEIDVERDA
jgi:hypothetical protein